MFEKMECKLVAAGERYPGLWYVLLAALVLLHGGAVLCHGAAAVWTRAVSVVHGLTAKVPGVTRAVFDALKRELQLARRGLPRRGVALSLCIFMSLTLLPPSARAEEPVVGTEPPAVVTETPTATPEVIPPEATPEVPTEKVCDCGQQPDTDGIIVHLVTCPLFVPTAPVTPKPELARALHTHDGVAFDTPLPTTSNSLSAANYYIGSDFSLENSINFYADTTNLCLNGKKWGGIGDKYVRVTFAENATLNIYDCPSGGTISSNGNVILFWKEYGTCNLYGGTLLSAGAYNTVVDQNDTINKNSVFNLRGGTVKSTGATSAIGCQYMTVNLYGGTVISEQGDGVIVCANGTLKLCGNTKITHGSGRDDIKALGPNTIDATGYTGEPISIYYAKKTPAEGDVIVTGVESQEKANQFTVNGLPDTLSATYDNTTQSIKLATKQILDQLTNLAWDSTIPAKATWGAVANATGYSVTLFKDGSQQGSAVTTAETTYDFTNIIKKAGSGNYTFKLVAKGNAPYADSAMSDASPAYTFLEPQEVRYTTDGTNYIVASFSTAVRDAKSGSTITVIADVELGDYVTISKNLTIVAEGARTIQQTANITETFRGLLNSGSSNTITLGKFGGMGAGNTLTIDGQNFKIYTFSGLVDGKVILYDGVTIQNSGYYGMDLDNGSAIYGGTVKNSARYGICADYTIAIQNCIVEGNGDAGIYIDPSYAGRTITIANTTVRNNKSAGIDVNSAATVNIQAGTKIYGNTGAGVVLDAYDFGIVFNMSGGEIYGNAGGGIRANRDSSSNSKKNSLYLTGGKIYGNKAYDYGGAVTVNQYHTLFVSGDVQIYDNFTDGRLDAGTGLYKGTAQGNLYLGASTSGWSPNAPAALTIADSLAETAKIGLCGKTTAVGTIVAKSDGTYSITDADLAKLKWDMTGSNARELEYSGAGTDAVIKLKATLYAPKISKISAPASVQAGKALTLTAPTVNDGGATVTKSGWQTCATNSATASDWATFTSGTAVAYSQNNHYLRYFATNSEGTTYSNAVQITVSKIPVTNTAKNANITYSGATYDVTALFQKDTNAGTPTYTLQNGTGTGSLSGSTLTITKAGTIQIKMTTAESGDYAVGAAVTATLTVSKGASPAAPTVGVTAETIKGKKDGTLTSVTSLMEYKTATGNYSPITGITVTGLAAGIYSVRVKGTDLYLPGDDASVTVTEGAALIVTFESKGGSAVAAKGGLSYNATITAPADPIKPSFTFGGWYKETGCTNAWDFTNGKVIENITLYAKWTAKTAVSITETAQTKTYTGSALAFDISGTPSSGFTVTYKKGNTAVPNPTDAGSYEVIITRDEDATYAAYSKTITGGLVIAPKPLTKGMLDITGSYTYTGSAITPTYTVTDGSALTADDYTAGMTDNTNAGTAKVTITGKGNYTGSISKTFAVEKKEVTLTWADPASLVYTGTALSPTVTASGTVNGETLSVTFSRTSGDGMNVGAHVFTAAALTGAKATNYKLPTEATHTMTITKAVMVGVTATGYTGTYDGKNHNAVTVSGAPKGSVITYCATQNGTYTSANKTVQNAISEGQFWYKVTNPNYGDLTGSVKVNISALQLTTRAAATVTTEKIYDGNQSAAVLTQGTLENNHDGGNVILAATASYDSKSVGESKTITITYTISGAQASNYIKPVDATLSTGKITIKPLTVTGMTATPRDYDGTTMVAIVGGALSGKVENDAVTLGGTATGSVETAGKGDNKAVTVTGYTISGGDGGNYSFTQPVGVTVTITPKPYNALGFTITGVETSYAYTNEAITPPPEIKCGATTLINGTDYTLSYTDNKAVGKNAKVNIAFTGNYSGSAEKIFEITYAALPGGTTNNTVFANYETTSTTWSSNASGVTFTGNPGWTVSTDGTTFGAGVTFTDEGDGVSKTVYVKNGNNIYITTVTYKLDKTLPVVSYTSGNPQSWTNADATILFSATDALSGVKTVTVSDGTAAVAVTENKQFVATKNGTYTITVTDNAGKVTTQTVVVSKIDKTAPAITLPTFDGTKWFGATEITATVTDAAGSGVATVTVSGGHFVDATDMKDAGKFTATEPVANAYTYTIAATDTVGNSDSKTVTIKIDLRIDGFMAQMVGLDSSSDFSNLASAKDWYEKQNQIVKNHIDANDAAKTKLENLNTWIEAKAEVAAGALSDKVTNADTLEEIAQAKKDFDSLPKIAQDSVSPATKDALNSKLDDAKKAQNVIEQLENAHKPGASYEEKQSAKDAYEKLTEDQKKLVPLVNEFMYDSVKADLAAIDAVLDKLNAIKKPYTPETKAKITEAKTDFGALNDDQKDAFPTAEKENITKLVTVNVHVAAVELLITNLAAAYDVANDAAIKVARAGYDTLTGDEKMMIQFTFKAKLDGLYQAMLDSKNAAEKAEIEAAKNFTDKVNEAIKNPDLEKIKGLIAEKGKLPDGVYAALPDTVKADYDKLVAVKDIIEALEKVTDANISAGETTSAVDSYDGLSEEKKDLVDKATDNKTQNIKDVKAALDKIEAIPAHSDKTEVGAGCGTQSPSHATKDHQEKIEAAKEALSKLPEGAKGLLPEGKEEAVEQEYAALIRYLDYVSRAVTAKSTVEVVGMTDKIELPADSVTAGKTIISVEMRDEKPAAMPPIPQGKGEALSVDVKLVAKIFADTNDAEPVATENVQPKDGKKVLVKLLLPTGFKLETLEIWHVKDSGGRSRIFDFWLVTEADGIYALFEVASFSHFVFFAEKVPVIDGGGIVTPPKPSIPSTDGGNTTVTPPRPKPGVQVAITPKPDEGYQVDKIIITDQSGKEVPVTKNEDGTYFYIQPEGKVTIQVIYKPIGFPFTDVVADDWFYSSVKAVSEAGLMKGTAADKFSPYQITSRGMFATILWRIAGEPQAKQTNPFPDVLANAYDAAAVAWCAENGIVRGYDSGKFVSADPITREQLVSTLYRYAQLRGMDTSAKGDLSQFSDGPSNWAADSLRWAVGEGLIAGKGNGILDPQGEATRGETAKILVQFMASLQAS